MALLSFRNGFGKAGYAVGKKTLGAASAALLVPLLISSQDVPQPLARLAPASLSTTLAHDAAPVDLTTTLSNAGTAALTWRVGAIRDVSRETAPAVATGPVAAAKVYAASNAQRDAEAGEIIVALKETSGAAAAPTPPSQFLGGRCKVKKELAKARRARGSRAARPRAGRKLLLVSVEDRSSAGIRRAIDDLRKDPNVAYAEPNYRVKAIGMPDDPEFGRLYGMHNEGQTGGASDADIDAPEAWNTHTGGDNVVVGIIDTGIDYLHPDLAGNMWTNPGEIPANGIDDDANGYVDDVHGYDFVNDDPDPMDDHFHGTHVAGTVAAVGNNGIGVAGVAWKAKLAALKFLDAGGSGNLDDAIEAVAYANAMGITITNNSWGGGGFSQALKDVIDAAGERGHLFIAAAGNASNDNDAFPSYPSSYESANIVAVAATDHVDGMAFFSSYGATSVDLGAPGVDTYSCMPGGRYDFLSGTSMATPHVAGAAALIKSFNPQLTGAEIKAGLLAGVDPVASLSGRVLTGGRLNIAKSLEGVSPPWLTVAPKGPGSLEPGASQVLTATVDPKGLVAGRHRGLVTLHTNDPTKPDQELEVIADVSGCKSLSATPASLEFGPVWETTSRRLVLTLRNACNDFTTVGAVESSHGTFAAAGAFPLRVPPFGTAAVEIVYTPDGLGDDAGTLTVRSDAGDRPVLSVAVSGTGVEPPKVAVNPSRVELTLDPSGTAVRTLTVSNTGGDALTVDLRTAAKRDGAAARKRPASARIIPGKAPKGNAYAAARGKKLSGNLKPAFRASAAGLKVLYLTTLLPTGGEDQFVSGLRGLANVGSVDVLDGGAGTPNLEFFQGFDVVLLSSNFPWADPFALGNTLADYVDAGGAVGLLTASIASGGGYSLQGRITEPGYMPIEMAGPGRGGDATEFEVHPITEGVTVIGCNLPTAATRTQGRGESLGRYPSGSLVGAVNPDKAVVAINVFPADFMWGGDVILLMGNTLDWLSGAAGWVKVEPRNAVIPPGQSFDFALHFNAEGQLAGLHESAVEVSHNAPAGPNPVAVPVRLTVNPVKRLSLSAAKHDFGGVLVGGSATAVFTLSNTGNETTTVSGIAAEGDFASAVAAPIPVPAFSSVEVAIGYSPKEEGGDLGSLTFSSDAADNPSLRIVLRGRGLPAPLAVLAPERLTVSLAHDAAPRDLTATMSNQGRGELTFRVTSVRDVTPAPSAAAKAMAVQSARIYRAANYDLPAVPGELIVGFKEGAESFANAASVSAAGLQVKRSLARAKAPRGKAAEGKANAWKLPRRLALVTLADGSKAGVQRAIEALRKDANVAYAEPNYRVKAVGAPNDPDFGLLYGMHNEGQTGGSADADIDAPEAWDTHTGDETALVGVIDTGIDYLHPDLAANIWTNPGEIAGNGLDDDANGFVDDVHGYDFVNEDGDPMDDHFHGTHVAGTIAAVGNNGIGVAGVAWKAKLAGLKFLDAGGSGNLDDAIEAVAYANAMGISITNNSWGGGGFSQALKDVIDAAGAMGHLFVAAAGNDNNDNDAFPSYPSSYESGNIIAVAATDHRDGKAFFSSYGATTVDLGAPGVDTYSTTPGAGYQFLSGTSMATPHVSGAAALIKGFNPAATQAEIKTALLASTDAIPSMAGITLTGGRLNVAKALGQVSPPWLTVAPRGSVAVAPGASQALTATVNPAGLVAGEHRGVATIATNDPKNPTKRLEVVATVSGCKSLSASPTVLDFGSVWTGTSRRLAVVLKNACNDYTTLARVESSHRTFAAATALPLVIPPFGTVSLEIAYTPDDLKGDKAALTLRSDAQDHPAIRIDAKGTGVKPPAIKVEPGQVSLALDPSEQKTVLVKVQNKGGADLVVDLKAKADRAAPPESLSPKVTASGRKAGRRYARLKYSLQPRNLHPMVQASASGLKVLYLTTLFQPDSVGDSFTQGLRGLPQVASLDRLDGSFNTPNADYLQAYDVVVVSADAPWADQVAVGDALAAYVDAGGRVVLLTAAIAAGGGYELLGRMGSPEYMPIVKEGPGMGGTASSFADHPITRGLVSINCGIPTAATQVQGGALALGQYDTGTLLGSVHADKAIVAINVYPGEFAWSGDLIRMMSNTLDWLASFAAWVKVEPGHLVVPAGKSVDANLLFDSEGLAAGAYTAQLTLAHNAPATSGAANPVVMPIRLDVKAKKCLEASTASLDFGRVWNDRNGRATVELANPCNLPTTVSAFQINHRTFATSAQAPLAIPAFSSAAFEVTYTPDDLRPDKGLLLVKSDAQDHPSLKVALAGTGVKPPTISVRPATVLATLDPGVESPVSVEVRNDGGDTLRVKSKAVAAEEGAAAARGKLTPGTAKNPRAIVGETREPLAYTPARRFRGQAAGLKIAYVHSVGMIDTALGDQFLQGMRTLSNVGSVDQLDARWQTPDAAWLSAYDVVVVASDWSFADPFLLGEALADYVDAGGKVVMLSTAFSLWGVSGRIMSPDYLPIEPNWTNWDAHTPVLADHPINEGVAKLSSLIHVATLNVQGSGKSLGAWQNGYLVGAYAEEKPVVALNSFPVDGFWGGDLLIQVGNTFDFLANSVRWVKPQPRDLVVPPGQSRNLTLAFNTARMDAGRYLATLSLDHNAPAGPQPLDVPVTLEVRSKRCLAVEPASLDFGPTWNGGTSARSFVLANRCNEPTTVSRVRSGDAAFSVAATFPLKVPPFGSVTMEAAFAPKDLKAHKSSLEIVSDAPGAACLKVAVTGQGIRPPSIAVTPSSLEASVAAGESATRALTVSNPGGDVLTVDLKAQLAAAGGLAKGSLVPGAYKGAATPWSWRGSAASAFARLAKAPAAKAAGLRVLYVTTLIPDSGATDRFSGMVRSLPQVGSLEVLNAQFQTPDAAYLLGYDAVIVAANFPFADPLALGDALADYVDRGGRAVLMTAAISDFPGLGLQGRISEPGYMPIVQAGPGPGGAAFQFEDHPINRGVKFIASAAPTAAKDVQGEGLPLARMDNGILLGAYHGSKAIVALNVFPSDFAWKGDLDIMLGNMLDYLDGFGAWLRVEPRSLIVPAGGSAAATVTLDGSKAAGGTHQASLLLSHNAPGQAPVVVPVAFTVAGSRALSVLPGSLDFGAVLLGSTRYLPLILANSGNLPVTIASRQSGDAAFAVSGATFPLELDAGERVSLVVAFAPSTHGAAAGSLAFVADGAAPVSAVLSGTGLRPADLTATTAPSPLRFTVAEGGTASGSLDLANLGDEGLSYKLDVLSGSSLPPGDGGGDDGDSVPPKPPVPPKPGPKASAYGPQHHAALSKGALDTRVGAPVDASVGGPDAYGHRWVDSREVGGPAFAWTDISETGRRLEAVSACDDCAEEVGLSFLFPFYHASGFGSVFVGSNGYVTFGAPSGSFSNHPIPSASMPGNLVAALFQDLYPAGGAGVFFQDYGNRAVIQYAGVPDFQGTGTYDFQIVLHADGTVELLYKSLTGVKNTATVGIQDGSAADGLGVVYNAEFLEDNLAVRLRTFVTAPGRFGRLDGEDRKRLPVSLDARGLAPGNYPATLDVSSSAASGGRRISVPVELIVTPAPETSAR